MKKILIVALLMLSIRTQSQTTKVACVHQNTLNKVIIDNPKVVRVYIAPNNRLLVVVDSIRKYKWKIDTTNIILIKNDSLNSFLFIEK